MRRCVVVLVLLVLSVAACSDEGDSDTERACEAWSEHKAAGLTGDELLEDMRRVADLAVEAGGVLADAGESLRQASVSGDADAAFADMELACAQT